METVARTYCARGKRDQNGGMVTRYEYDAVGRPVKFTAYTGSNNDVVYAYDAAGRIAQMTNPYNQVFDYEWTDRGELSKITWDARVWDFEYNALGQRTQYTHPNGTRTEYAYDNWHRLTGIYHKNASTNAVLDSFEYTLSDGNDITRIDHADGANWRYVYDDRGRLEKAYRYAYADTMEYYYEYIYDAADNMTKYWSWDTLVWHSTDYEYNAGNEQISMTRTGATPETRTYDAWGRLATRTQDSHTATYEYRYGDRLYQVLSDFPGESDSPVYDYGADGKLRRRGAHEIQYGLGFNPVAQRTTLFTHRMYVYEPHKMVSERLAYFGAGFDPSQWHYYHDHLGSVRSQRDQNGGMVTRYEYGPYGAPYGNTTPLIFALHPYESGMGFYHAPNRNYSPASARWTTPDPAGMIDGPNMYGYVKGNPIMHHDPLGLWIPQAWDALPTGGKESCLCAGRRIGNDVAERYPGGYRDKQDHMRHCVWTCELRRETNLLCAWIVGTGYEMMPPQLGGSVDNDPFDYRSNRIGRRCGGTALNCDACCAHEARKRGL